MSDQPPRPDVAKIADGRLSEIRRKLDGVSGNLWYARSAEVTAVRHAINRVCGPRDADLLAAIDPATVSALLAELAAHREAEARRDERPIAGDDRLATLAAELATIDAQPGKFTPDVIARRRAIFREMNELTTADVYLNLTAELARLTAERQGPDHE